ncbi:MAG: FGGY-family carbohydrate kinase [Candidatus Hermodarchaeota archaeon]
MSNLICVFDCGTTGTRTVIFDNTGKEIAKAYEEYVIPSQPVGISEQNPQVWWNAIRNTTNMVVKSGKFNPDDIVGISGSFARGTVTLINKERDVLHPALTWMDDRELLDAKGHIDEIVLRNSIPKLLWLKENKPELFSKTFKIICPDSYTYMKLCGEFVTDPSNAIGGILNLNTLKMDEDLAEAYELPIDLWPEVHEPGEVIGELSSEAANDLGLKPNIPIVLGGGDQQCAALGLGVVENGQAKVTTGTGTFVDLVIDEGLRPSVEGIPIFTFPHVIKGKWMLEGVMPGTGTMFQTYARNFSQLQIKESQELSTNVYDTLTKEAEQAPPGCNGLLFVPLYIFRKGTIHGLGWHHGRPHFARAIMESSALSANMYLGMLEAIARVKTIEVKVDGGGMNSDFWAQIFADILNRRILIPENKDGGALGAAILGFYGTKTHSSIESAIESMSRFVTEKNPIKENVKAYKKLVRLFLPIVLETNEKKRVTKDL